MHYYIDGYNLLFRLLKAGDEVRKQREQITVDIEKMVHVLDLDVTLVFDSHYQEDENTKSHFKSLEIIFTAKGESADEFILQELKESKCPTHHTVVTSDKKLARLCQMRLALTESVDEFLAWITKRYKNKIRPKKQPIAPLPAIKTVSEIKKQEITALPTSLEAAENCFSYYLETFEKEIQELESQKPPPPKPPTEPKKIKVKKRKITKEEEHLSLTERWQKAFENRSIEDSDNFIF